MKITVNDRVAYAYTGGRPFDAALPSLIDAAASDALPLRPLHGMTS